MTIDRFDILMIDLSDAKGSEQGKIRPCVVVGNEPSCQYSPVIIVMPLTHKMNKPQIPTHRLISTNDTQGLQQYSILLGEQPKSIDRMRIKRKIGKITSDKAKNMIDQACIDAFFYNNKQFTGGIK